MKDDFKEPLDYVNVTLYTYISLQFKVVKTSPTGKWCQAEVFL